jgi:hypothetical protein
MKDDMQRPGFLEYRRYRYLKLASLLTGACVLAYWITKPQNGESYGGTWFGYVLGITSALIVLLHAWYGVRKRRPPMILTKKNPGGRSTDSDTGLDETKSGLKARPGGAWPEESWRHGGTLQGWLSAHVYLGVSLIFLASLHTGFRFGWNIHTLTYVLLLIVLATGFYGTFAYLRYPRLITENNDEDNLNELLRRISELDELARIRALDLPDDVNALVTDARLNTRLGGGFFQQLSGKQRACPTELAVLGVRALGKTLVSGEQPRLMRDLYSVLLQKQRLVAKARNEISLNARMQFWLYLHAPLSIALVASLSAHVIAILVYW